MGWGIRHWAYCCLIFICFSLITTTSLSHAHCAAEIALGDFKQDWDENFSQLPSLSQVNYRLGKALQRNSDLPSGMRHYLQAGGSAFNMGNAAMLLGVQAALLKKVEQSRLAESQRQSLRSSLEKAIQDLLSAGPPAWPPSPPSYGGGSGDEDNGDGGTPPPGKIQKEDVQKDVEKILKDEYIKRCIKKTAILFIVSNAVNAIGAIEAKWSQYAEDEERSVIRTLLSKKTWKNAADDPDFLHNMTFNALLMTSMGALSCVGNDLGKNAMAAVAAVTSGLGQYISHGEVKPGQLIYDTVFIRFLSVNKSNLAFHYAEKYQHSGRPAAWLVESALQLISEGVGAVLYPRGVRINQRIWGEVPESDHSATPAKKRP